MASTPQQTAGQQGAQPHATSPSAPENVSRQRQRRSSISQSATSEDSPTLLLDHPSSSETSPKPPLEPESQQGQQLHQQMPNSDSKSLTPEDNEQRKCWICLQTEDEDLPTSSPWRSPCQCALQAHQDCLLDWVADLQTPKPLQGPRGVECPQCKTPIAIWRPRSYIAEFVRDISRITNRLALPATALTLAGGILCGCYAHGLSTIYVIFGTEDAERLLGVSSNYGIHKNLEVALPLIPIALILSRTTYVDTIIPVLPILYLCVNSPSREAPLWPPSAAMTVVMLPYLRAAYNRLYGRFFAEKEGTWMKEVLPRAGEGVEGGEIHGDGEAHNGAAGMGIGVEIQLEINEEDDVQQDEIPPPAQPAPAEVEEQNQRQDQGQDDQEAQGQPAAQRAGPQHMANQMPIYLDIVLQRIVGALFFPTIASGMGIALNTVLPRAWTIPPGRWDKYPVGFLQSRFGRSVAGGCLFIVLKDSLLLYSKYRVAQTHKQRRILDYDASRARKETNVS